MEQRVSANDTTFSLCETLADTFSEQPVDGDFVLPEYCPDVASVLKCTLTPMVQSRQLTTDRLMADGVARIRVLYLDEERHCVRCCEFSVPFSTTFQLPALPGEAFIRLTPRTDYVNCRAVSPRRLDVHGAFTLRLRVMCAAEQKGIGEVSGEGVYARHRLLRSTVPAALAEKSFTVSETMELSGKSLAEQVLRTSVTPVVTDCKVLLNKAILKGVLMTECLYSTDTVSGHTETVRGEIPFSQILDMDGLTEEWLCDADVAVVSEDIHAETSEGGESGLISVNVKMMAALQGYRSAEWEMVSDAYSARCPMMAESRSVETLRLTNILRDERTVRLTVEPPTDEVRDVVDLWCEVSGAGMSGEENALSLDGRLLFCMLVRDGNGILSYYERAENFTLPFEDGGRDDLPDVRVCRASCQTGSRWELKADLSVTRRCTERETVRVLTSLTADEEAAYPPDKAALKICYAQKGEALWDIARRCHTSVEAVMEENHLSGETLSADTMLLIPLC